MADSHQDTLSIKTQMGVDICDLGLFLYTAVVVDGL